MAAKKRWLHMAGDSSSLLSPPTEQQQQQQLQQPAVPTEEEPAMPPKKRLMLQLKHKESQKKRVSLSEYYRKKGTESVDGVAPATISITGDAESEIATSTAALDPCGLGLDEAASDIHGGDLQEVDDNFEDNYAMDMDMAGYDEDSASAVSAFAPGASSYAPYIDDEDGATMASGDAATAVGTVESPGGPPPPVPDELGDATDAREFVLQQHQRNQRKHRHHHNSSSHSRSHHHSNHSQRQHHRHVNSGNEGKHHHYHHRHGSSKVEDPSRRHEHKHQRHHQQQKQSRSAHAFDAFVERQMQKMRDRQAAKAAKAAAAATTAEQLRRQLELREGEKVQRAESFLYGEAADHGGCGPSAPVVPVSSAFIDRVVGSQSSRQQQQQQRQVAVVKPQISSLLGGIVRLVANSLGDVQRRLEQQHSMLAPAPPQQQQLQLPQAPQLPSSASSSSSSYPSKAASASTAASISAAAAPSSSYVFLGVAGYGNSSEAQPLPPPPPPIVPPSSARSSHQRRS